MKSITALILASLLIPNMAYALTLGGMEVKSKLNQRLQARIELRVGKAGELEDARAFLADQSTFDKVIRVVGFSVGAGVGFGVGAAVGLRLEKTLQATLSAVLIRKCSTGIHLVKRNRNIIISHCHIYQNRKVGIHFDHVDLHQAIVCSSHISYNPVAGIWLQGGGMRNFQFVGNDIEYNHDAKLEGSADLLIDMSPEGSSFREEIKEIVRSIVAKEVLSLDPGARGEGGSGDGS